MRAALFRRHGGPEVMEVGEVPDPVPGPGQALVRVRAAALNHIDVWVRRGLPALKVDFPHVPGGDVCGVVAALGPGADGPALTTAVKVGDRVVVNPGLSCGRCPRCLSGEDNLCPDFRLMGEQGWGGQAELLVVPAVNLVPAPAGPTDEELAAVPIAAMTAWQMLVDKARLRWGETILVLAAGSGVGVFAIQIAKLHGARVIAAASSDDKLARARALGADETVRYGRETMAADLRAALRTLTGRRGVDVIVDHVGSPTLPELVKACARGGRIVTCGATGGHEAAIDLRYVFWRQISLLGSTMAPKGRLHTLLGLLAEGRLRSVVHRLLPLDQVSEAHRLLEDREVFGKVVLQVS
jgi:NADPH:quinone reductase-like Zn-dependent oxidoreductase